MKLVSVPPDDHPRAEAPGGALPSASFDDIYDAHFPFVWRCLRGMGVDRSALDDVAQDVFLVVHRQLAGFRGEADIRTWLYAIARRVASNHLRGARRKQAPLQPLVDEPTNVASAPGPHERAEDAEAAAFVQRFLARLDDKKRDLFILAVLEEMTIPEVAAALAIPVNTAYTRLRAARADFQAALARQAPERKP